ncbi:hypothetical protein Tco_0434726 [Tanacetum coccineum]
MIELQPSRGKLPTKPLFKYLSLIGHKLSDDQLFIKALEEFKPSVYGENYEEENENATHEKGYNASKKRKQAIEEFAFNKASYYDWDKLADDEKGGILEDVPEVNKNAAGVIIESFVNDVSSDAALDETMIHDRVNGKSVNHVT